MKSAQRQFLIKVSGVDGFFQTKSGGSIGADTNKVWDGGQIDPDVMSSPSQIDNITVSRAFDIDRDEAMLGILRKKVGRSRHVLSVTPTNEDLQATGKPVVYSDALLVGLTEMDADSSSGDAATFEFEFAVGSVT